MKINQSGGEEKKKSNFRHLVKKTSLKDTCIQELFNGKEQETSRSIKGKFLTRYNTKLPLTENPVRGLNQSCIKRYACFS